MNINDIQKFGYAELYELEDSSNRKYGRFVGFSYNSPDKICYSNDINNIIGVTSINFACLSDHYIEWPGKYVYDQYGESIYQNKTIAAGKEKYDAQLEIAYIKTYKIDKQEKMICIDKYNKDYQYISRLCRNEWIPVTLLGKCIVEDDGSCIPGEKCYLYEGDNDGLKGTVTLTFNPNQQGWKVLKRISKNTIMIFIK